MSIYDFCILFAMLCLIMGELKAIQRQSRFYWNIIFCIEMAVFALVFVRDHL